MKLMVMIMLVTCQCMRDPSKRARPSWGGGMKEWRTEGMCDCRTPNGTSGNMDPDSGAFEPYDGMVKWRQAVNLGFETLTMCVCVCV